MERYADFSKALVELSSSLRDLGIAEILKLPTIVMLGDQSSGKSSVLQRLSHISVPRDVGTCTKVPVEVRMKTSSIPWNARISIEMSAGELKHFIDLDAQLQNHTHEFISLAQNAILFQNLENWKSAAVKRKRDLETKSYVVGVAFNIMDYGGYAGEAVVRNAVGFMSKKGPVSAHAQVEPTHLKFSKSRIVIEVESPELSYLTVVDLPGIIHSVENKEDEHYIEDIRKMVEYFASKEHSILAATIDISKDLEVQEVWKVVKKNDPTGKRTIGILTKVDRCENVFLLENLLGGKKYQLEKGHFALINPSTVADKDMDVQAALDNERRKFKEDLPTLARYERQLGIENVRDFLSATLTMMLKEQLPRIIADIENKLKEVEGNLKLRAPLKDPEKEMFTMLDLLHSMHREECMARGATILDDSTGEFFKPLMWKQAKDRVDALSTGLIEALPFSLLDEKDSMEQRKFDTALIAVLKQTLSFVQESPTPLLPSEFPHDVVRSLIREQVKCWDKPIEDAIEACMERLLNRLLQMVDLATKKDRFPEFNKTVAILSQRFFDKNRNDFEKWFKRIIAATVDGNPGTRNSIYFNQLFEKSKQEIMAGIYRSFGSEELIRLRIIESCTGDKKNVVVTLNHLGGNAVQVISTARAFVHINKTRFIDNLMMSLENFFLNSSFGQDLKLFLLRELGLFAISGVQEEEDGYGPPKEPFKLRLRPEEEKEISQLKRQQESLRDAQQKLWQYRSYVNQRDLS